MRRFRPGLAAATIGALVLSGAGPVLAGFGVQSSAVSVPVANGVSLTESVQSSMVALDPETITQAFVHGATIEDAVAAVDAAGLTLVERYDLVGIAVAAGTPAAILSVIDAPGVTHVEDAAVDLAWYLDTSHEATRGAEVLAGFTPAGVAGPSSDSDASTSASTAASGNAHGHDKDNNGKAKGHDKGNNGKGKGHGNGDPDPEPLPAISASGAGVSIAIVDSGIDGDHPFFLNADGTSKVRRNLEYFCSDVVTIVDIAAGQQCLVDAPTPQTDTTSVGGHGTHVAGIAAGNFTDLTDGRRIYGAAPGADLIGLSVGAGLNITGGTSGLYWVLQNHADPCGDGSCPPIKVVNNSWGVGGGEYNPDGAVGTISDALVDAGVVVVFAAGNDGGTGSTNEVNPYAQNPTNGVFNVANYDDGGTGTRDGGLASSSSRAMDGTVRQYPDISAPGSDILSSCRLYLPVCSTGVEVVEGGDYNTISGTSMAAPHIAGIAALMFSVNPELTPGEIEDIIEDTAHQFAAGADYEPDLPNRNDDHSTSFDKGHGLVDAVGAVSAGLGFVGPPAALVCTADGDLATDARADASESGVLPNEPSLDIVSGRADWDATAETLTTTIVVDDLSADPGVPTAHRATFAHGDHTIFVLAEWDRATGEQSFQYGYQGTISQTVLSDLTGSIDEATNTITVSLTNADIDRGNPAIVEDGFPPVAFFTDGDVLSGWNFTANKRYSVVVVSYNPPADSAGGSCPYTIGLGAVPPPPPPPTTDPDPDPPTELDDSEANFVLGNPATTFSYDGAPATATHEGVPVEVTGPAAERFVLHVYPAAAGSTVTIDLVASSEPEVQDFDFSVFDADGAEVASSGNPGGIENATFEAFVPGKYVIEVRRYAVVEAGYTLSGTIN